MDWMEQEQERGITITSAATTAFWLSLIHILIENHHGVKVCHGHAFKDTRLGSHNTNFALLRCV